MTADLGIVVVGARDPRGPDGAALQADYRVDELHAEIRLRLGGEVSLLHGRLGEAPPAGAILLFCPDLDEALSDAPPGTAARVIWMNAGRTEVREALAKHGLLGAVERFRYLLWVKSRAQDRAGGLYARAEPAAALLGSPASLTVDARMPGYVRLGDDRYQDLLSLIRAYAAVAAGQPPPAPDRVHVPPEFPLEQVLDVGGGDAYRITRAVGGTRDRGLYHAEHVTIADRAAYVTLGLGQTISWERKRADLDLPAEGFAPVLGTVRLEHEGTGYDALIEGLPGGVPLSDLLPDGGAPAAQAARILLPVLGWVAGAHRAGRVVSGLRPELVFAALTVISDDREQLPRWGRYRPRPLGVVPRGDSFLATAERPCHGFGPPFETLYQAPELLALRPPTPAADVFSLAAILAWLTSGAYPFPGDTMVERITAMMTGAWARDAVPDDVAPLLAAALSPDPAARPALSAVEARLAELAR